MEKVVSIERGVSTRQIIQAIMRLNSEKHPAKLVVLERELLARKRAA